MTWMRSALSACLVLTLVLTSAAMAVARSTQPVVQGTMVICTGTGPITLHMDAEGQPVGPAHFCPDCALGFFGMTPELAGGISLLAAAVSLRLSPWDRTRAPVAGWHRPLARAPPVV